MKYIAPLLAALTALARAQVFQANVNLALHSIVTIQASSSFLSAVENPQTTSFGGPAAAIDDNVDTAWVSSSSEDSSWIEIDLGYPPNRIGAYMDLRSGSANARGGLTARDPPRHCTPPPGLRRGQDPAQCVHCQLWVLLGWVQGGGDHAVLVRLVLRCASPPSAGNPRSAEPR